MAGIRTDDWNDPEIFFSESSYVCFRVRPFKRGNAGVQPFIQTVAPPPPENTTMGAIWRKQG